MQEVGLQTPPWQEVVGSKQSTLVTHPASGGKGPNVAGQTGPPPLDEPPPLLVPVEVDPVPVVEPPEVEVALQLVPLEPFAAPVEDPPVAPPERLPLLGTPPLLTVPDVPAKELEAETPPSRSPVV